MWQASAPYFLYVCQTESSCWASVVDKNGWRYSDDAHVYLKVWEKYNIWTTGWKHAVP